MSKNRQMRQRPLPLAAPQQIELSGQEHYELVQALAELLALVAREDVPSDSDAENGGSDERQDNR